MAGRVAPHHDHATLDARHAAASAASRTGSVALIVLRRPEYARTCPLFAELSPENGLIGDRWQASHATADAQLSLMDVRVASALAERLDWQLAGDNLIVDCDVSMSALRVGQTLRIGDAELEITAKPHLGCKKFAARYGHEALHWVNAEPVREQRRRGVYAQVLKAGTIKLGDVIERC